MNVSVARASSPIDQMYNRPVRNRITGRTKACKTPKMSPITMYEKIAANGSLKVREGKEAKTGHDVHDNGRGQRVHNDANEEICHNLCLSVLIRRKPPNL